MKDRRRWWVKWLAPLMISGAFLAAMETVNFGWAVVILACSLAAYVDAICLTLMSDPKESK